MISANERSSNALRFKTEKEARASAHNLFMRWTIPIDFDAERAWEPVNYRWDEEKGNVFLEPSQEPSVDSAKEG